MWPFYWSILSAEWDESDSQALFELVVNLFLTIRGFSYASTCIRMHKNIAGNTFLCSCRYRMISMNWSSLFPMQRLLESSRWNKCNTCEMLPSVEWRDASEGVSAWDILLSSNVNAPLEIFIDTDTSMGLSWHTGWWILNKEKSRKDRKSINCCGRTKVWRRASTSADRVFIELVMYNSLGKDTVVNTDVSLIDMIKDSSFSSI